MVGFVGWLGWLRWLGWPAWLVRLALQGFKSLCGFTTESNPATAIYCHDTAIFAGMRCPCLQTLRLILLKTLAAYMASGVFGINTRPVQEYVCQYQTLLRHQPPTIKARAG